MSNQVSQRDEPSPEGDTPGDKPRNDQAELDRIAAELAERASKRERHFDSQHDIFTK